MPEPEQRIEELRRDAAGRYGLDPRGVSVVRAPYRVCPLGAHVDHQLGPVTALAIDRGVLLAFAPAADRTVRLASRDFPGEVAFSLDDITGPVADDWGNLARGAARALHGRSPLQRGIVGVVSGELHGQGLSSSAAVGVAYLLALEHANGLEVSAWDNVALDQAVENGYLGLRNGILDPAAVLLSRHDALTRIDCAAHRHEWISTPPDMPPFRILLAFSGLRGDLTGTDYNRRVAECSDAARALLTAAGRGDRPAVLGEVTVGEYALYRDLLGEVPARRAAHFFGELRRVERGVDAWRRGDLAGFARRVTESGASSIHNYECGSPPLVDLYRILLVTAGVLGARFSGAGFRGCCVALVEPGLAEAAAALVLNQYQRGHPELAADASVVLCDPADGAEVIGPEELST